MAQMFWSPPTTSLNASINDSEFFSFTTEGQPISRASLSKTIMKKVTPEVHWRKFTAKLTDFTKGMSDHMIIPKKTIRDDEIFWKPIPNEFDTLDNATFGYKKFTIGVEERAIRFPFTQRAKLFSNYDIEAEIVAQAKSSIIASIERDLVANGFLYLDILGVCTTDNKVGVVTGKSLLPTKQFSTNDTPITISQASVTNTSVEGISLAPMTMGHIIAFAQALSDLYTPSYSGNGFGNYVVILNSQAYNELLTDERFFQVVSYGGDPERIYSGYLGQFYGQEFILDKSKFLDRILSNTNQNLRGKAVAVFLSKDAVYEAIALPEQVLPIEKADHGRFMAYAIQTYRGESPMWFASADGQGSGGVLIGK